jgi:hypothetical protein
MWIFFILALQVTIMLLGPTIFSYVSFTRMSMHMVKPLAFHHPNFLSYEAFFTGNDYNCLE